MANKKISQLTPKGSALAGTDLLEVSVYNGVTYDTKSLTGANVVSGLQPTLVSGTSIKTINSTTLLGSGDVAVQPTLVSATNIKTINSTTLLGSGDIAVQPTLVSATNIKTINSTSLLGSGDIAISTGLTVGTTAIASGTTKRVLFQDGSVVSQSANFVFDASNQLVIGGHTGAAKIDVKAGGALSTDLVQKWTSSSNTQLGKFTGDGAFTLGTYTNASAKMTVSGSTSINFASEGGLTAGYFQPNQSSATLYGIQALARQNGANTGKGIYTGADGSGVGSSNYGIHAYAHNGTTNYAGYFDATGGTTNYALYLQRGDMVFGVSPTLNKIGFWNATPIIQPTTAVAAAAFVANTGNNVKEDSTFDGYTLQQVVKALRNSGLLA
jgi:hypothetical protein